MTAEEALKQGDVSSALQLLQETIKKQPANAELRVFLFQLLVVSGQWERALTQLKVAGELDDSTLAMVSMYRQVIACEQFREEVFSGNKEPLIFGKPNQWMALLIEALKLTAQGQYEKSQQLRAKAFDLASAIPGKLDDQPFEWFADSDPRLGPVIEAIVDGRYLWAPVENIRSMAIDEPSDLRDVVWLPVHFTWSNGGENYGLMPTRYPFSYQQDDLTALSRKTQWRDLGNDLYIGFGQKIFSTDMDEYAMMNIRSITFDTTDLED